MEQYFIDFFESYNPEKGYNQTPTAGSQLGIKRRPETIEKMRIASAGRIQSKDEKLRRAEKHRKIIRTKEWRAAISAAQIGKPKSEQARANIKANQWKRIASRAGYKHSAETIEKIRLSNIATKSKNKLQLN